MEQWRKKTEQRMGKGESRIAEEDKKNGGVEKREEETRIKKKQRMA